MRVVVAASVLISTLVMGLSPVGADPGNSKIKWENVVGIIQTGNLVGKGTGLVMGSGQPWFTEQGKAEIDLGTGRLKFKVRGLVLMGGNGIGTRAGVTPIKGTLVCDVDASATGNSVLVDTELVPLSLEGDADFTGEVALDPLCVSEADIAFLIRTANGAAWIAAGAVRVGP